MRRQPIMDVIQEKHLQVLHVKWERHKILVRLVPIVGLDSVNIQPQRLESVRLVGPSQAPIVKNNNVPLIDVVLYQEVVR